MAGRIVVETSSWADPGFVEEWYPRDLSARNRLPWYAERFEGVEVNAGFYALPALGTVERWVQATPPGFRFDCKLHRLLSRHSAGRDALPPDLRPRARTNERGRVRLGPRLQDALLARTRETFAPLAEAGRLSAYLLQLSPAFKPGAVRLDDLAPVVEALAPHPVAIELRHRGWVDQDRLTETLGWLERHGAAFVATDAPQGRAPTMLPPIDAVTHPGLAYLRAHGRNAEGWMRGRSVAERFGHVYTDAELDEVRERAEGLAEQAAEVRLAFNNNRGADAPRAAQRLRELLGQVPEPAPA